MPINNVYDSRFDPSTHELERKLDDLMPRSNPAFKRICLESNQTGMTSINISRLILRGYNRVDVKVCVSEANDTNCYSAFLNLIGLSEDIAYSPSVMAVTIAAHEVGHALQPKFVLKLSQFLRQTHIKYFGCFIVVFSIPYKIFINKTEAIFYHLQLQLRYSISGHSQYPADPLPQHLQQSPTQERHFIIRWIGISIEWVVAFFNSILFLLVLLFVVAIVIVLIPLSICWYFLCQLSIFSIEIDASIRAMYLLRHNKILDVRQQQAARKFLIAAASTYLPFGTIFRLFI